MTTELTDFYLQKEEPHQSCLIALRDFILQWETLSETRKYGMPCFIFKNKALLYLWTDKKTQEPYVLFVDGQLMNDSELETGDRKRMKIFRVSPTEDLPIASLKRLINASIALRS